MPIRAHLELCLGIPWPCKDMKGVSVSEPGKNAGEKQGSGALVDLYKHIDGLYGHQTRGHSFPRNYRSNRPHP